MSITDVELSNTFKQLENEIKDIENHYQQKEQKLNRLLNLIKEERDNENNTLSQSKQQLKQVKDKFDQIKLNNIFAEEEIRNEILKLEKVLVDLKSSNQNVEVHIQRLLTAHSVTYHDQIQNKIQMEKQILLDLNDKWTQLQSNSKSQEEILKLKLKSLQEREESLRQKLNS
ncbi:hypothetical protein DLAC_00141 [Tieghemostelium lacteum]|uniref:Uncharacterized protein n=1 Tax=Tieghemostelium lacteum TaxID=361077 RepID=A0A152A8X9_TIELA|nr:hypothetical protein DLAC_00141 [Tieghemostelium lacteum]|eukprot:KYR02682.1 hypothetical protein DLAC_00141 [Tieghemostelium lacteum]